MTNLGKIQKYAEHINNLEYDPNDPTLKDDMFDYFTRGLDSIAHYHDVVVRMEANMQFAKLKYEDEEYRDWLENQNKIRISAHEGMIASVSMLTRYCRNNGLPLLYEGKIDEDKLYKDPDTRFGIAKWADEYCSEIFKAGIGDYTNGNHKQIIKETIDELNGSKETEKTESGKSEYIENLTKECDAYVESINTTANGTDHSDLSKFE